MYKTLVNFERKSSRIPNQGQVLFYKKAVEVSKPKLDLLILMIFITRFSQGLGF